MRRPKEPRELQRKTQFETFEERLALSAQSVVDDSLLDAHAGQQLDQHYADLAPAELVSPIGDFNLNLGVTSPNDNSSQGVQTQLSEAHELTGVNDVYANYGFDGTGQTVAIIDSGIAYDHVALGGGFGNGYRVVGGWDFAENDANPYDDGPAGFHGTHVAGIVGSDDATHRGVASGADLVALRVFDDNGAGYFSWVESALQWVHDNRDAFENPITTVNLSLGTNWNADSIPSWTMLEDEFSQLEEDGIFIAVSAGNSFQDYNTSGLSYPAASPYVIPVASVDDTGLLSYFSQRSDRVLAAPGRSITSTVPDYLYGADGDFNDFGAASGTSMAAPYTAGASVLVRQAMEYVGIQDITQDTIYDHFRATADVVYDSETNASYHRINVQSALDALMPGDDFGSTVTDAHALGTLNGTTEFSGRIDTLSDVDYFSFVAGRTGTVNLTVEASDGMIANFDVVGGGGTLIGSTLSFDVVTGQTYVVSLQSSSGMGSYDAELDLQASVIDWGSIEFKEIQNQDLTGAETWYQFVAGRDGTLTVDASFDSGAGDIDLFLYNSSNQLLGSSSSLANGERIDVSVTQGETLTLRAVGANSNVDFRVTNLVSVNGDTATVRGTAGDDVFAVVAGQDHIVTVNGVRYVFDASVVTRLQVEGNGGQDAIVVTGDSGDDTATLSVGSASLVSDSYQIDVTNVEMVRMYGGGGNDTATFFDSTGDDRYYARANTTESAMMGTDYYNYAQGFERTYAYATSGGDDRAEFYDSAGDDRYHARANSTESVMTGTGYYNYAQGFGQTYAYATFGGDDRAEFYDSAGNDRFYARANTTESAMMGTGYYNYARGFGKTYANATFGGDDRAEFYDSTGDDRFYARADSTESAMMGAGYYNYARGFGQTYAYATFGGDDRAEFYDSAGNDRFYARANTTESAMMGTGYYNYARGFGKSYAYATFGGDDRAEFYDSTGDDRYYARANTTESAMMGTGFYNYALGFGRTYAYATFGGNDLAEFYDSQGDDQLVLGEGNTYFYSDNVDDYSEGFDAVQGYSAEGGTDTVNLLDSAGNGSEELDALDFLFDQIGGWS